MGSSMPTTPRVGMAVATAIMAKMTTNSPRRKPQRPKATWTVNSRTNSKKNAAGVAELSPRREPWMTMLP